MRFHVVFGLLFTGALVSFSSCSKHSAELKPVAPLLAAAKPDAKGELDYVARFDQASQASVHSQQVQAAGGTVQKLDSEGRIQRVRIAESRIGSLTVDSSADVAPNAQIQIQA